MSVATSSTPLTAAIAPAPIGPGREAALGTSHLEADLKRRSVRGGTVTLAAQAVKFGLQMSSMIVLARLLTPRDYGLVGMAAVVTGFFAIFKDLGLSQATIQRDRVTQEQVSVLFWVNVVVGVLLVGVTAALSPLAAWFYGEPRIGPVMLALSASFVFGGLSAQHYALLRRQMRFSAVAVVDVASMALGIAMGILAAVLGAGYWSLVVLTLFTAVSTTVLAWTLSRWRPDRPRLPRRGAGVGQMLAFGGNMTGFSVVNYFTRNSDNLLIGWFWGAGPLGIYAKAYQLLSMPLQQLVAPISAVVVPALSRLQNDPGRYRRYYRQALAPLLAVVFPLIVYTALDARDLVLLVLGDKWVDVAMVFVLLSPAALIGGTYMATGWVYVSLGRADRQLRWGLLASSVTVVAFAISLPWGIEAMAAAFSIVTVALRYPSVLYCFRGTPVTPWDLGNVVWRPLIASGIAAVLTWTVDWWTGRQAVVLEVLLSASLFTGLYVIAWLLLPGGGQGAKELTGLLQHLKRSPAEPAGEGEAA